MESHEVEAEAADKLNFEEDLQGSTPQVSPAGEHKKSEGRLPVIEIFGPVLQGEGAMIGVKTHFIRFGGCDFRCKKCDSLHAVMPDAVKANATWVLPEDVMLGLWELEIHEGAWHGTGTKWVTLSGGNPCMWDLQQLIDLLHNEGYKVALETQGSIWANWVKSCDQITVSPKGPGMGEHFYPEAFTSWMKHATRSAGPHNVAVKIVVFDQRDFEFAVELDQILTRDLNFSSTDRYLSLGNPYPPVLLANKLVDPPLTVQPHKLPEHLLREYKSLLEDYLPDRRLAHWKFLPQLHVLLYGNETAR